MGGWHGGLGGGMGMAGGAIPRTNKAAHTSCGNGPACALTRPGNLHPPPLRAGGAGGMMRDAVLREGGRGRLWGGLGGDAHPGYLGRGAGAGGSFVSLETGPAVSAAPLCRFVRAPRPPARRRGRTWGCGGTGTPPASPPGPAPRVPRPR